MEPGFFQWCPVTEKQWIQTGTQAEVFLWKFWSLLLGHTQKSSGHGSEKPTAGAPT